ncbi:hypothetical protein EEB11_14230 [Pseudotabrizicola sediminis]|uniref:MotA/TolQ/ExbB proton channel domain-containing protein n=1 Tax=Pseudotabrizicola sediminis TaxID=2486418 RepID=A0ABY2KKQ2_9RHOB|nr:DUF6635 family protein [Pseudotabrizicola sediminis]TGD42430.1 hypothetical protein EEB11_14230 [Pseudotabrizicola sediminis]
MTRRTDTHGLQDRVEAFVHRHFTWPGTLHLHRAAAGLDILRAPVNVVLSPILVLVRLGAWICRKLGMARMAGWLLARRLLLRTAVSARVEAAILTELLDAPLSSGTAIPDRAALSRAILAAPRFREVIRSRGTVAEAQAAADRIVGAVGDYTATRSSIAEFTTGLVTLAIGAIVFQALTPGMISMAPGVAQAVSHGTAVADFPLGAPLGGVWYGVFPVGPSPGLIAVTVLALMLLGSVIAAFAGIFADPLQARLGIHRRRLMRLFRTLDAEMDGTRDMPFAAQEHLLPRTFDLWDAALSVLRVFRG